MTLTLRELTEKSIYAPNPSLKYLKVGTYLTLSRVAKVKYFKLTLSGGVRCSRVLLPPLFEREREERERAFDILDIFPT